MADRGARLPGGGRSASRVQFAGGDYLQGLPDRTGIVRGEPYGLVPARGRVAADGERLVAASASVLDERREVSDPGRGRPTCTRRGESVDRFSGRRAPRLTPPHELRGAEMAKLIQICASQNDPFALDEEGRSIRYNF